MKSSVNKTVNMTGVSMGRQTTGHLSKCEGSSAGNACGKGDGALHHEKSENEETKKKIKVTLEHLEPKMDIDYLECKTCSQRFLKQGEYDSHLQSSEHRQAISGDKSSLVDLPVAVPVDSADQDGSKAANSTHSDKDDSSKTGVVSFSFKKMTGPKIASSSAFSNDQEEEGSLTSGNSSEDKGPVFEGEPLSSGNNVHSEIETDMHSKTAEGSKFLSAFVKVLSKDETVELDWPMEMIQYTKTEPFLPYSCNPLNFDFGMLLGKAKKQSNLKEADQEHVEVSEDKATKAVDNKSDLPSQKTVTGEDKTRTVETVGIEKTDNEHIKIHIDKKSKKRRKQSKHKQVEGDGDLEVVGEQKSSGEKQKKKKKKKKKHHHHGVDEEVTGKEKGEKEGEDGHKKHHRKHKKKKSKKARKSGAESGEDGKESGKEDGDEAKVSKHKKKKKSKKSKRKRRKHHEVSDQSEHNGDKKNDGDKKEPKNAPIADGENNDIKVESKSKKIKKSRKEKLEPRGEASGSSADESEGEEMKEIRKKKKKKKKHRRGEQNAETSESEGEEKGTRKKSAKEVTESKDVDSVEPARPATKRKRIAEGSLTESEEKRTLAPSEMSKDIPGTVKSPTLGKKIKKEPGTAGSPAAATKVKRDPGSSERKTAQLSTRKRQTSESSLNEATPSSVKKSKMTPQLKETTKDNVQLTALDKKEDSWSKMEGLYEDKKDEENYKSKWDTSDSEVENPLEAALPKDTNNITLENDPANTGKKHIKTESALEVKKCVTEATQSQRSNKSNHSQGSGKQNPGPQTIKQDNPRSRSRSHRSSRSRSVESYHSRHKRHRSYSKSYSRSRSRSHGRSYSSSSYSDRDSSHKRRKHSRSRSYSRSRSRSRRHRSRSYESYSDDYDSGSEYSRSRSRSERHYSSSRSRSRSRGRRHRSYSKDSYSSYSSRSRSRSRRYSRSRSRHHSSDRSSLHIKADHSSLSDSSDTSETEKKIKDGTAKSRKSRKDEGDKESKLDPSNIPLPDLDSSDNVAAEKRLQRLKNKKQGKSNLKKESTSSASGGGANAGLDIPLPSIQTSQSATAPNVPAQLPSDNPISTQTPSNPLQSPAVNNPILNQAQSLPGQPPPYPEQHINMPISGPLSYPPPPPPPGHIGPRIPPRNILPPPVGLQRPGPPMGHPHRHPGPPVPNPNMPPPPPPPPGGNNMRMPMRMPPPGPRPYPPYHGNMRPPDHRIPGPPPPHMQNNPNYRMPPSYNMPPRPANPPIEHMQPPPQVSQAPPTKREQTPPPPLPPPKSPSPQPPPLPKTEEEKEQKAEDENVEPMAMVIPPEQAEQYKHLQEQAQKHALKQQRRRERQEKGEPESDSSENEMDMEEQEAAAAMEAEEALMAASPQPTLITIPVSQALAMQQPTILFAQPQQAQSPIQFGPQLIATGPGGQQHIIVPQSALEHHPGLPIQAGAPMFAVPHASSASMVAAAAANAQPAHFASGLHPALQLQTGGTPGLSLQTLLAQSHSSPFLQAPSAVPHLVRGPLIATPHGFIQQQFLAPQALPTAALPQHPGPIMIGNHVLVPRLIRPQL